jgi:aromatic ring-cleaving dioxygenase
MIRNFHIHLYYDDTSIMTAKELAKQIQDEFSIAVGTFHERNVGPHPRWSVQLSVPKEKFGEVLSHVAINRKGLTVFSHPDTGHDLEDHTDYAIWMGELLELNLEIFKN